MEAVVTIEHHQGTETIENVTGLVETDSEARSIRVWSGEWNGGSRTFHNARVTAIEG